jgi:hypothetical protein
MPNANYGEVYRDLITTAELVIRFRMNRKFPGNAAIKALSANVIKELRSMEAIAEIENA